MRASRATSVISANTSPAPPIARLPRCTSASRRSCRPRPSTGTSARRPRGSASTRSRSRNGVNIGGGIAGLAGAAGLHCVRLRGDPFVHARDKLRIAHPQVLVRDAQPPRQQRERELERLERHVALGVLEPLEGRLRGALQALDRRSPRAPRRRASADGDRRSRSTSDSRTQRDRVLHRQPRARADGEVRGVRGVAEQHDVAASVPRARCGSVGNCRQMLRLEISRWPSSSSANSRSRNAAVSASRGAVQPRGPPRLLRAPRR